MALMIDAVRVFSDAVYDLRNIETVPIDCNSNDDWKHGYSLVNKIRSVNMSHEKRVEFKYKKFDFRVYTMD